MHSVGERNVGLTAATPSRIEITAPHPARAGPTEPIVQTPLAPQHPDLLIHRTLASRAAGAGLVTSSSIRPSDGLLAVPSGDMPIWPSGWQCIPGSRAASADERFVAYTTGDGAIATVHSTVGPEPSPSGRLIALIGLGGHRVCVMDAGEFRFLARWTRGATTHQVTVGPTTLAAFMELVLNAQWS